MKKVIMLLVMATTLSIGTYEASAEFRYVPSFTSRPILPPKIVKRIRLLNANRGRVFVHFSLRLLKPRASLHQWSRKLLMGLKKLKKLIGKKGAEHIKKAVNGGEQLKQSVMSDSLFRTLNRSVASRSHHRQGLPNLYKHPKEQKVEFSSTSSLIDRPKRRKTKRKSSIQGDPIFTNRDGSRFEVKGDILLADCNTNGCKPLFLETNSRDEIIRIYTLERGQWFCGKIQGRPSAHYARARSRVRWGDCTVNPTVLRRKLLKAHGMGHINGWFFRASRAVDVLRLLHSPTTVHVAGAGRSTSFSVVESLAMYLACRQKNSGNHPRNQLLGLYIISKALAMR